MFPDNSILGYIMQSRPQVAAMLGLTPQARINQGFSATGAPVGAPPTQVAGTANTTPMGPPGGGQFTMPRPASPAAPSGPYGSFGDLGSLTPQAMQAYAANQRQMAQGGGSGAPMSLAPPNPGPSAPSGPPPGLYQDNFLGRLAQMGGQRGSGLIPKLAYLTGLGRRDTSITPGQGGSGLGDIY